MMYECQRGEEGPPRLLMQRQQLKVMVAGGSHALNTQVTEDLIELGLARREGDNVVATDDGRYVANWF